MEVAIPVKTRGEWENGHCPVALEPGTPEEGEIIKDCTRCKNLSSLNGFESVISSLQEDYKKQNVITRLFYQVNCNMESIYQNCSSD